MAHFDQDRPLNARGRSQRVQYGVPIRGRHEKVDTPVKRRTVSSRKRMNQAARAPIRYAFEEYDSGDEGDISDDNGDVDSVEIRSFDFKIKRSKHLKDLESSDATPGQNNVRPRALTASPSPPATTAIPSPSAPQAASATVSDSDSDDDTSTQVTPSALGSSTPAPLASVSSTMSDSDSDDETSTQIPSQSGARASTSPTLIGGASMYSSDPNLETA